MLKISIEKLDAKTRELFPDVSCYDELQEIDSDNDFSTNYAEQVFDACSNS